MCVPTTRTNTSCLFFRERSQDTKIHLVNLGMSQTFFLLYCIVRFLQVSTSLHYNLKSLLRSDSVDPVLYEEPLNDSKLALSSFDESLLFLLM